MLINRKFLHYLLWILIFIQGFVQLSNLPTAIYRIGVPLIILLLFLDKLYTNRESFKAPLLPLVIIFVMVSFISSLLNKVSYFNLMYFYIYTIQNYIYFLIIYNEIDVFILKKIGNLIILLFFIQIPATFYKLIVFGRTEHGIIGTISTYQGSLSAIIPLFAITYLYSKNLFNPKKKIY